MFNNVRTRQCLPILLRHPIAQASLKKIKRDLIVIKMFSQAKIIPEYSFFLGQSKFLAPPHFTLPILLHKRGWQNTLKQKEYLNL